MRFNLLARRITLAPTLALALALTVAACSSSSSTSASTSARPRPRRFGHPGPCFVFGSPAPARAPAAARPPWRRSPRSGRRSSAARPRRREDLLLQNGSKFASVINAQAGSSIATGAAAKVTAVVVNSPTSATVSYDILLNGTTALPNQTGTAVFQDGSWKVGDVSFCQLLKLEGARRLRVQSGKAVSAAVSAKAGPLGG